MNNIIIVLLLVLFNLSCNEEKKPETMDTHPADKTMKKFEVVETMKGGILWRLRADSADVYEDTTLIYDVDISFYDADGEISSILTSDSGYIFPSGDMLAKGNVVVTSMESGRILKTETLFWRQEKEKIMSEDSVTIIVEDGIVEGDGFESDPNLTKIKIRKIRAVGDERSYTARADSSVYIESYTYLYDNVELVIDTVTITSDRALMTEDSIRVWDNLRIEKKALIIYGGLGRYFFDRMYHIENGIRAEMREDTLTARKGMLYEEKNEVYAKDSLVIWNEDRSVEGNEGFYNFETREGIIWGDVLFKSKKDTIELASDTVTLYGDTLVVARRNTLAIREFKVYSDSLWYYIDKDLLIFRGDPFVITGKDSLRGDYMKMVIEEGKIIELQAKGNIRGKRRE